MIRQVVRCFADGPGGFCSFQLVERVKQEGCFQQAPVVALVEPLHQPPVRCGLVEAGLGGVFDGAHGQLGRIFMNQPVSVPSMSHLGSQFFLE